MKIYIVRQHLDWHNDDPSDVTTGFEDYEDAKAYMNREYNRLLKDFAKNDNEAIEETIQVGDDYTRFTTEADDYYYSYVTELTVQKKSKR